jgi:hypothetical protein
MTLLRKGIEISPTSNLNAGRALLDRPIRFTCTVSVLDDGMAFFCRETFHIPASVGQYDGVYVSFVYEDLTCNKHITTTIASLGQHFFRSRLLFLCRRGHASAPKTTSEQWRNSLPVLPPRHSSIAQLQQSKDALLSTLTPISAIFGPLRYSAHIWRRA